MSKELIFSGFNKAGDFSEYDSTQSGGSNTIAVSRDARMNNGRYGIVCHIAAGDTNKVLAEKDNWTWNKEYMTIHFWFDPNGLAVDANDVFTCVNLSVGGQGRLQIQVRAETSYPWGIQSQYRQNDNNYKTTTLYDVVTDAVHYVEVHLRRAGAGVGYQSLYLDGALLEKQLMDVGTDTVTRPDDLNFGVQSIDAGDNLRGDLYCGNLQIWQSDEPFFIGKGRARLLD